MMCINYGNSTDNEVDGFSLLELTVDDIFNMMPGKVGPARKLTTLITKLKQPTIEDVIETADTEPTGPTPAVVPETGHNEKPSVSTDEPTTPTTPKSSIDRERNVTPLIGRSPCSSRPNIEAFVPTYSTVIQEQIKQNGTLGPFFDKFIEETSYHVLSIGGMDQKGIYDEFGALMCSRYPCLAHSEGKRNWSYFNAKLSQKIRFIRWKLNKRSESAVSAKGDETPKRKRAHLQLVDIDDNSTLDPKEAKTTITKELQKPAREQDKALILKAQRASFRERRQFVAGQEDGKIHELIKEYPILGLATYIEKEFHLLKPNMAKRDVLMERWTDLTTTLDQLFGLGNEAEEGDEEEEILELIKKTEDRLKLSKRSSKKTPPGVITVMDCKDVSLTSTSKEAPRLVFIRSEGKITSSYIIGDKINIPVHNEIREALLTLLMAYYVWDLSYPKTHQLLGFLQVRLLEDNAPFHKSTNYMTLSKMIQDHNSTG